jgi:hypothetical protein
MSQAEIEIATVKTDTLMEISTNEIANAAKGTRARALTKERVGARRAGEFSPVAW